MDRKALIRQYKENPRPAGLYVVRNIKSGRLLVGSSADLPGILNRQRFQLEMGSHPDTELQREWNELGPDAFVIEVLDELAPSDRSPAELGSDLTALREIWIERLHGEGRQLYPTSTRGLSPTPASEGG